MPTVILIARNTWLIDDRPASFRIKFHATTIVTYQPDGNVTLAIDGHPTVTTRERMNRYLPLGYWIGSKRIRSTRRRVLADGEGVRTEYTWSRRSGPRHSIWWIYRRSGSPDYTWLDVGPFENDMILQGLSAS